MKRQLMWMLIGIGAGSSVAAAQAPEPAGVIIRRELKAGPADPGDLMYRQETGPAFGHTMDFVATEMAFGDKPVKSAPYSADAVTETTQILGDGNRITRQSTTKIYRDSEGRTRREETLGAIGPWAAGGPPHQTIVINDPVADVNYVLNPKTHTAHKLMFGIMKGPAAAGGPGVRVFTFRHASGPEATDKAAEATVEETFEAPAAKVPGPDLKTESLGKQMIEGVEAEGTRRTVTIPAGAIGNERPIESVSERWYSAELQTVAMSRHSDPRFGETVYRLMNIQRGEQPPTLFEVPSDYTVKDDPAGKMMRARKKAEEAKAEEAK